MTNTSRTRETAPGKEQGSCVDDDGGGHGSSSRCGAVASARPADEQDGKQARLFNEAEDGVPTTPEASGYEATTAVAAHKGRVGQRLPGTSGVRDITARPHRSGFMCAGSAPTTLIN